MKQINDIESFFDGHIFEDTILFGFNYSPVEKDFCLILNDPNVLDKELRVFLKLKFSGVRNYEREPGLSKEKSFVEGIKKQKMEVLLI